MPCPTFANDLGGQFSSILIQSLSSNSLCLAWLGLNYLCGSSWPQPGFESKCLSEQFPSPQVLAARGDGGGGGELTQSVQQKTLPK